mmetsp:Transcript_19069/g.27282  ORF Transcript_19069/g.27282 Transcript_19069/m.27282 type:complete len:161 (-) Transcript_19069:1140-1622(-)
MLTGNCLCTASKFNVPTNSVRFGFATCHCNACRLSHASPTVVWSGLNAVDSTTFEVQTSTSLSSFKSSETCTRYFCSTCGTHLYIKYDEGVERWSGEVHFPTAILSEPSLVALEAHLQQTGKPRYLHVFYSDRQNCLGDLTTWANAPKYGGASGLEPIES